jgi:hypothetical protein
LQLQLSRQVSTIRRASPNLANQFPFRHSARSRTLKFSMYAVCTGLPG